MKITPEGKVKFAPFATGSRVGHLLFRRENTLMAQPSVPHRAPAARAYAYESMPLFESQIINSPTTSVVFQYDVTADGKRFLVVTNNVAATTPPLTVVANWNAALKK